MATLSFTQIENIIKLNPNRILIQNAKTTANKLMMHVLGQGLDGSIPKYGYFESNEIYAERKTGAISNKDLFARLLQREEMVFTAQGGVSYYDGLSPSQTQEFDAKLDKIRFNMTIRKWIKEFALNAYRTDPMSVLFMEISKDGKQVYPTYKSIDCIFDYSTTGRQVEYVIFNMTVSDCINQDISDPEFKDMQGNQVTSYYRVVDDVLDKIVKNTDGLITQIDKLPNPWQQVPALITSDLINFSNPQIFFSPLEYTIELADTFLTDRSIRNLSKKYTGFAKVIEPLLQCGRCNGTGYLAGGSCPDCTTMNDQTKGSGYKLTTKVSDVARFPIDTDAKFDYSHYFGYVTPDIKTWDKQDTSLNDTENFIHDVYWGTTNRSNTTGPVVGETTIDETATKTLENQQPIFTRLNLTADWAEETENKLCDFIGKFLYPSAFKSSNRTYGRYYILETPDELLIEYLDAKTKGAPMATLTDILSKYYHSLYSENKVKLAIALKLMAVEPFIHQTVAQVQASNPARIDFFCKMYFSEWLASTTQEYLFATPKEKMITDLTAYATVKMVEVSELLTPPTITVGEAVRTTT